MKEIYIKVNIKTINSGMVISISGAQCTGKTTLVKALMEEKYFKGNTILTCSPSRSGIDKGIRLNKEAGLTDQLWIATTYVKNFIEAINFGSKHVISDRCLIDVLCYTDYHYYKSEGIESNEWSELRDTVTQLLFHVEKSYDYHLILKPEFDLIDNGVRSIDKVYQKEVNDLFTENVNMLMDFVPEKIITLTGSVEDRVNMVLSLIKTRV